MRLFVIPAPYDYHRQGEYIVMAEDETEAKRLFAEYAAERQGAYEIRHAVPDEMYETDGPVYFNQGCDC